MMGVGEVPRWGMWGFGRFWGWGRRFWGESGAGSELCHCGGGCQ